MKKYKNLQLGLLFVVANLLAAAAWWWFFGVVNAAKNEILATRTALEEVRFKISSIKSMEDIYADIAPQRASINAAFIGEKELVHFIEELERIAVMTGTNLEVVSAAIPKGREVLGPSLALDIEGDFSDVYKFLALTGNMQYQIMLEKAELQKNESKEKGARPWKGQLAVRILSYNF